MFSNCASASSKAVLISSWPSHAKLIEAAFNLAVLSVQVSGDNRPEIAYLQRYYIAARRNRGAAYLAERTWALRLQRFRRRSEHADNRHDVVRDQWLASHNYRVLRFWNNDVLGNVAGVLETIATALADSPLHPPRI